MRQVDSRQIKIKRLMMLTPKIPPVTSPPVNQKDIHMLIMYATTASLTLPLQPFLAPQKSGSFEHELLLLLVTPCKVTVFPSPQLAVSRFVLPTFVGE